jgi:hypothetical protein
MAAGEVTDESPVHADPRLLVVPVVCAADDFAFVSNCPGRSRRTARDGFDELAQAGERCPPRG